MDEEKTHHQIFRKAQPINFVTNIHVHTHVMVTLPMQNDCLFQLFYMFCMLMFKLRECCQPKELLVSGARVTYMATALQRCVSRQQAVNKRVNSVDNTRHAELRLVKSDEDRGSDAQSVEKYNLLQYTEMLSDGDSTAFKALQDIQPYSDAVPSNLEW